MSVASAATVSFSRSDVSTNSHPNAGTLKVEDKTTLKVDAKAFFDEYVISNGSVKVSISPKGQ